MKIIPIIGLLFLIAAGYVMGCVFPPSHFFPTSGVSVTEVAEELRRGIEYIDEAINLTEQGQYDKAREMLENAKKSSDAIMGYVRPYEKGEKYLDTLTSCMNNLVHVTELSRTNNTAKTVEYIDKFLADFSDLENIGAELSDEKYPGIAEMLDIEKKRVNLKSIEYDMMDFKEEYGKNKTVLPPPISVKGELKEFKWKDHLGKEHSFKIKISERRYEKYDKSIHNVDVDEDYLNFITPDDRVIKEMAEWFNNNAYPDDKEDRANCILSFVQRCVPYVSETQAKEYCRYPIETIIEGGDCGDKSVLFLSILKAAGYDDIALIHFEDHAMGGIALEKELKRTENGVSLEENGRTYYVCETTEVGWSIGRIREEYMAKSPRCLVVSASKSQEP